MDIKYLVEFYEQCRLGVATRVIAYDSADEAQTAINAYNDKHRKEPSTVGSYFKATYLGEALP
jgi:hypothetical protein